MAIACLPWYSLPEVEPAQDAVWSAIARHLRHAGVAAPERLIRNVPIPGVFCDPDLMLAQCCGYDVVYGFAGSVMVLATPVYAAPGCEGPTYRSFVLVRDDSPLQEIGDLRGGVCAVNSFNSHSGANALRALVAPLARDGRFFRAVKVTGAHVRSLELLMAGRADVMAMDCVLHALLARHRPAALHGTRVIAATEAAPAPPLVTSAVAGRDRAARVREAVLAAMDDPEAVSAKAELLIDRLEVLPIARYARIVEIEGEAVRRGFFELHATSPAIVEG